MPLKIGLKPNEAAILGKTVVRNGASRCELTVENDVPVIREKDILTFETANTPVKRLYLTILLMYLGDGDRSALNRLFIEQSHDLAMAAPSMTATIADITMAIMDGRFYQALRATKQLIEIEHRLLHPGEP